MTEWVLRLYMRRCVNTKTRPTLPYFISLRIAKDYSCFVYRTRHTASSEPIKF